MTTRVRIAVMLAVLTVMGCKGAQPTSAASGAAGGDGGSGAGSGLLAAVTGGGTKVSTFTDPMVDNMTAFSVTAPAGWQVQGTVQRSGCTSVPSTVFRASSPDSKSRVEMMPLFGWTWGTGPMATAMTNKNCLPLQTRVSAEDFLKYMASMMKVNYVGPVPVPADLIARNQAMAEQIAARFQQKGSESHLARALVSFQEGSVQMKGRLAVKLDCSDSGLPPQKRLEYPKTGGLPHWVTTDATTLHNCVAYTQYISAPANQLDSVISHWEGDKCGAKPEEAWFQADSRRQQQAADDMLHRAKAEGDQRLQAQRDQFAHDQAVNRQMNDEFRATLTRGTQMSMDRTRDAMNARGTATSDWVDYSLNRQTVMDTRNGVTYKVPNQVTVQDPLTKVHGDGTPIQ